MRARPVCVQKRLHTLANYAAIDLVWGKRSVMLSWLPRQRARMERIEVEAETMIRDFGADAYFEARRREHESSSDAIAKDWDQMGAGGRPQGEQTRRRRPLD
jgi:hypothetical protein